MIKKTMWVVLVLLALVAGACAPAAPAPTAQPHSPEQPVEPTPVGIPQEASDAVEAARQVIMDALGAASEEVRVVDLEAVDWPNACLGAGLPDEMCAEVITPGYRIVLEHDGGRYELHTDVAGEQVRRAAVGLEWQREGGIAGFCDRLSVRLPDQVYAGSCRSEWVEADLSEALSAGQMEQLQQWLEEYGEVRIVVEDPAAADAMTITLALNGFGDGRPDGAVQQEMLDFAQELYTGLVIK